MSEKQRKAMFANLNKNRKTKIRKRKRKPGFIDKKEMRSKNYQTSKFIDSKGQLIDSAPIEMIDGVGSKTADSLHADNIHIVGDLKEKTPAITEKEKTKIIIKEGDKIEFIKDHSFKPASNAPAVSTFNFTVKYKEGDIIDIHNQNKNKFQKLLDQGIITVKSKTKKVNIVIDSSLQHNNSKYGTGKFYIAEITGTDPKYKYKREFLDRNTDYNSSSKTTWYSYSATIKKDGIYEFVESNAYKSNKEYFVIKNGERKDIKQKEIEDYLKE